jgi:hypothetical protein
VTGVVEDDLLERAAAVRPVDEDERPLEIEFVDERPEVGREVAVPSEVGRDGAVATREGGQHVLEEPRGGDVSVENVDGLARVVLGAAGLEVVGREPVRVDAGEGIRSGHGPRYYGPSDIVATERHCTPDRKTASRSVWKSFQWLL